MKAKYHLVYIIAFVLVAPYRVLSQPYFISGKISDSETHENLPGAVVKTTAKPFVITYSGQEGYFKIEVVEDKEVEIEISHLGYQSLKVKAFPGKQIDVQLVHTTEQLGEIEITSSGIVRDRGTVPVAMVTLLSPAKSNLMAFTVPAMLGGQPGIALASDGAWPASVNIRGLGEQRNLVLVDGNRIETSTDIAGAMSMTDPYCIRSIEVVKGGSAVRYGTGAMGGIVNMITCENNFSPNLAINSGIIADYQSHNKLKAGHIFGGLSAPGWHFRVAYTHREASDVNTPDGILQNSSFADRAISTVLGLKTSEKSSFSLKTQFFQAADVGIPGGSPFGAQAEAKYKSATRLMVSPQWKIDFQGKTIRQMQIRTFFQSVERDVDIITNNLPKIAGNKRTTVFRLSPYGKHNTCGATVMATGELFQNMHWSAGLESWQRSIKTSRERYILNETMDTAGNVLSSALLIRGEQPVPDSRFLSSGLFLTLSHSFFKNRLTTEIGFRADNIVVNNQSAFDPVYIQTTSGTNYHPVPQKITYAKNTDHGMSWNIEFNSRFETDPVNSFVLSVVKAYRAASPEERFKYIDLGSSVSIGNPSLNPETGWFQNAGWRMKLPATSMEVNVFANFLKDMISEKPGWYIFNYNDTVNNTSPDTLPAKMLGNISKAFLGGFDMKMDASLGDGLNIKVISTFVRGLNSTDNTSLPMIPPINGQLVIAWKYQWFNPEAGCRLIARQDKTGPGEQATGGAAIYSASVKFGPFYTGKFHVMIHAGVDNITDRAWKNHLSTNRGLIKLEPGRSFALRVSAGFN